MILTPTKILIVAAVLAIFFGFKKLPDIGKGMGGAIRNFRKGIQEAEDIDISLETDTEEESPKQKPELKTASSRAKRAYRAPGRAPASRKR